MLSTPYASGRAPKAPVHTRALPHLLLAVLSAIFVTGCKSGPTQADLGRSTVTAGSIVYNSGGLSLGLISETMLADLGVPGETADERKMNFYSVGRSDAQVKVAPDDAIAGLASYFDDEGFKTWAAEGTWTGTGASALTVSLGDEFRTMEQPGGPEADPAVLTQYIEFAQAFQAVYNEIQGFQNLNQRPTFEKPVLSEKLRAEIDTGMGLGGARR